MTDETDDTHRNAPFVSIVMLAFNQRDMVGEAMTSLLAQDYANFELVVSDDCSTDGTFEAMQAVAAAYAGPHTIRLNQTAANRGTLRHLYEAVALSSGAFIVIAGGDDISLPERVSTLVAAWQSTGAEAIFSSCTVIDAEGRKIMDGTPFPDPIFQSYFPQREARKIYGAMSAYDRRVFETVSLPEHPVYCEDVFFSLMIHYRRGKVVALPDRLVLYRNHQASFTNSHGSSISVENAELKAQRLSADHLAILRRFKSIVEEDQRRGRPDIDVDMAAVRKMENFYRYSAEWMRRTTVDRLRHATTLGSLDHLRWAAPRLFGLSVFVRLKALQRVIARRR